MNDDQLKVFISVAETGSFSKAGEQGFISKQAMLRQIDRLEQEVGCQLLVREKKGTTLTPAGEVFLKGIRKLLRERDKLLSACQEISNRDASGLKNVIRVGNVEHQALLTPVTSAFAARYPQIRIEQVIHPNHSGEWRVENDIQDVAETFFNESTDTSNYSYIALTKVPYMAAMRPGHPLAKKAARSALSLAGLVRYETIFFPLMVGPERSKAITTAFTDYPENLIVRDDVDNQAAVAYSCMNSNSILITANPFILSIKDLATVTLSEGWKREYGIIYREPMTETVQKYVDVAKEVYGAEHS